MSKLVFCACGVLLSALLVSFQGEAAPAPTSLNGPAAPTLIFELRVFKPDSPTSLEGVEGVRRALTESIAGLPAGVSRVTEIRNTLRSNYAGVAQEFESGGPKYYYMWDESELRWKRVCEEQRTFSVYLESGRVMIIATEGMVL
jgi:hypothetical protein